MIKIKKENIIETKNSEFINSDIDENTNIFNVEKYYKKIENIKYDNIFKNWNDVVSKIKYNNKYTENTNVSLINMVDIYKYDDCNLLLFYIIDELIELININNNNNKNSIIEFIIEYINYTFIENNINLFLQNSNIIKYINVLNSTQYYNSFKQDTYEDIIIEEQQEKVKETDDVDDLDDLDDPDEQEGYDFNEDEEENLDNKMENINNIEIGRIKSTWDLNYKNELDF